MKLLRKDGIFLADRMVYSTHLIKLYQIYTFYVEVITELEHHTVINADPVTSPGMLTLYKTQTE